MEHNNSEVASHDNKNMEDVSQSVPKPSIISNFVGPKDPDITAEHDKEGDSETGGFGDVNMEASISADDVMRAGGFGARDDISSFLPVASDSTDFEASLRDARDYEEPQRDVSRPGLGWSKGP